MEGEQPVGAVILAAGASRRFGSPKQLAVVGERTLLEHAIDAAAAANLAPVAAVVPVWLSRPARYNDPRLRWVRHPFPERGLSSSLRLGLDAIRDEVGAVVILLGDQLLGPALIDQILAARGRKPLIATEAGGVLAPPLLIERSQFVLVDGLSGDIGLRETLRDNLALVHAIAVAEHARDIDTPSDLERLMRP
ncbi:MAG: NTP transferase domain-containing protein [Candidatus Limnocylindria bacterium]